MSVILMKLQRWRKTRVMGGFMVDLTTWKMFKFIVAMINTVLNPAVVVDVLVVLGSVNSAMTQNRRHLKKLLYLQPMSQLLYLQPLS